MVKMKLKQWSTFEILIRLQESFKTFLLVMLVQQKKAGEVIGEERREAGS